MSPTVANRICMFLAFCGIFVAGVLTIAHYRGETPPCGVSGGCEAVARDPSSIFLGIPVAAYGLGAYIFLAGLAVVRGLMKPAPRALTTVGLVTTAAGTAISLYLMYHSIAVIKATCWWCVASAIIMTLSFVAHALLWQISDSDVPVEQPQAAHGAEHAEVPAAPVRTASRRFDLVMASVLFLAVCGATGWMSNNLSEANLKAIIKNLPYARSLTLEQYIPEDAHLKGEANAPITVVEFADLTCPHCKVHYRALKKIVDDSEGQIRLVYRHFPLIGSEGHELAVHSALIAELAHEKGLFWEFVDSVFNNEKEKLELADYLSIATTIGMDGDEILKQLESPDTESPAFQRLHEDINFGNKLGLRATPTFFLGFPGEKVRIETMGSYWNELIYMLDELEKKR